VTEQLIVALLGTFALGLTTWHIVRVFSHGSLFKPFREWLEYIGATWETGDTSPRATFLLYLWRGFDCRLCFETQVAIILTWGALVTGLVVNPGVVPYAAWGLAFAIGPFLTAAWSEILRRVECVEAPK
jgi:hypothetical protein